jgi:4-amino-4-deoxy-L-arabinose transferase-like glycosyltransferase
MNFDRERPTPSRLSAEAAARLPRLVLLALLAAFALPGVFGHDLWPEDAAAFGRMWTMAHGTALDWWLPNVAGLPTPQDGPLPFWLGAGAIRTLGPWLGEPAAARLTVLLWFPLAALSIWGATRRLAAGERAQPIAPAFGREPDAADYARLLADISVLIFVSTLGILLTLHVVSADTVSIAVVATALYGLAIEPQRPVLGPALAGGCVAALAFSRGPLMAAGMLAGCVLGLAVSSRRRWLAVSVCALCALAIVAFVEMRQMPQAAAAQVGSAHRAYAAWMRSLLAYAPLTRDDGLWLGRNASWYVWPLWPLAAWSLYAWRHHLRAPHIALPASVLAGLALALAFSAPLAESKLVPAIAPLAVLAAFGFPALRRTLEQWVDWFAIGVYTLFIAFVWAYFLALITGTPRAMSASVQRLIPGHTPGPSVLPLVLALLVTGGWVALIVWRVRRRPRGLWRGALLSAAGVTSLWLIAVALFLPAVDYNRSYRALSQQVGSRVPAGECVAAVGVSPPMRALVAFYGNVRFAREGQPGRCRFALQAKYRRASAAPLPVDPDGSWNLVWEGRRPVRSDETWRLWRLTERAS